MGFPALRLAWLRRPRARAWLRPQTSLFQIYKEWSCSHTPTEGTRISEICHPGPKLTFHIGEILQVVLLPPTDVHEAVSWVRLWSGRTAASLLETRAERVPSSRSTDSSVHIQSPADNSTVSIRAVHGRSLLKTCHVSRVLQTRDRKTAWMDECYSPPLRWRVRTTPLE